MKIALLALIAWQAAMAQNLLRPPTNPPSNVLPAELRGVGIDQKLNGRLPLDLHFRDENGRDVRLGEFFGARPVIITPVYYGCPMLCTQILNGLVSGLKPVSFNAGEQFDVLAVSFDPSETPALAIQKKDAYVKRYGRSGAEKGFHFLTGEEPAIKALTGALGFRYTYDPKEQTVRARERSDDHDARRPDLALPVRRRLRAAGFAAGAGRSGGAQDRIAGRRAAAVLLSLRSGDRQVRRDRDQLPAAGGGGDGARNRHVLYDSFPAGVQD